MFVYWGQIEGISANIKVLISGLNQDQIREMSGSLKEALVEIHDFLEDLDDELVDEAQVVERLLPADSEWQMSRIHESILLIYKYHGNRVLKLINKWWNEFVKGESIRGGGKLFKYISAEDKQFLSVHWTTHGEGGCSGPEQFLNQDPI